MIKTPPRLQLLFERGFELRSAPGYSKAVHDGDIKAWHTEPAPCPDGIVRFHWHASALSGCPRQAVLKRAELPSDPKPLNSEITLQFGHTVHGLLEEFSQANVDGVGLPTLVFGERVRQIGSEIGGCLHPAQDLNLKARLDWMLYVDEVPCIMDLKTEGTDEFRVKEAKENGLKDAAKIEHKLQITANAIIQEGLGTVPEPITNGAVTYCSKVAKKNEWRWDTQWFDITEEMRETVYARIASLDNNWLQFSENGQLPQRLLPTMQFGKLRAPWNCAVRDKNDDRGKYCEFRRTCFSLPDVAPTVLTKTFPLQILNDADVDIDPTGLV